MIIIIPVGPGEKGRLSAAELVSRLRVLRGQCDDSAFTTKRMGLTEYVKRRKGHSN